MVEGAAVIVEIGTVLDFTVTRDVVLVMEVLVGTVDGDVAPYPVLQSSCVVVVRDANEQRARRTTKRHESNAKAMINQTNVEVIQRDHTSETEKGVSKEKEFIIYLEDAPSGRHVLAIEVRIRMFYFSPGVAMNRTFIGRFSQRFPLS